MVATASAGSLDLCQVTEWLRMVTGGGQGWGGTTFWGHTDLGLNSSSTTYQLGDLQKVLFISRSLSSAIKQEPRRCCEFTTWRVEVVTAAAIVTRGAHSPPQT